MRLPSVSTDEDRLDLCLDGPFRAPKCGCGYSDPSISCQVALLGPQSHFPAVFILPPHSRLAYIGKNVHSDCSLLKEASLIMGFSTVGKVSVAGLECCSFALVQSY